MTSYKNEIDNTGTYVRDCIIGYGMADFMKRMMAVVPAERRESCPRCFRFGKKLFPLLLTVYSLSSLILLYHWMFLTTATVGMKNKNKKRHHQQEDVVMMEDQNGLITLEESIQMWSSPNIISDAKQVRKLYPGDLNDAYLKKLLQRAEKLQSNCPMQRSTGRSTGTPASESNNESSTFSLGPFQIIDAIHNQRYPEASNNYNVTCPYPPTQERFCADGNGINNKKQQLQNKVSVLIDFHSPQTDDVVSSLRSLFYHLLLLVQSHLVGEIILQTSKDSVLMFLADKKYGKRIMSWHQNVNHKVKLVIFHHDETNSNILRNPSLQSTPKYDCIFWLLFDSNQNKIMPNDPRDDNLLWKLKTGFAIWKLDPSIVVQPNNYENNDNESKSLKTNNSHPFSCPNQSTINSWQEIITQQSTPMLMFHRNYLCFLRHDTIFQHISRIISRQEYNIHNVNAALFQFVLSQINGSKPIQMTASINKSKIEYITKTSHIFIPQKYPDTVSLFIQDAMFYFGAVPTGYTHFCDFMKLKNTTIFKNESNTVNEGNQTEIGFDCLTSLERDHLHKLHSHFCDDIIIRTGTLRT